MFTKNFLYKDFINKKKNKILIKNLKEIINNKNEIIRSLGNNYKYSYSKNLIKNLKKYKDIRIFGMGGSSLGSNAIYDFLKNKINKNFYFLSNLNKKTFSNKKYLNLIISKSGNTLETIVNSNIFIKKRDKNILITENKKNILRELSQKLKAEIIDHNNYIGGRYSVLSEVGMLPAELMGLQANKFKQFNVLVKNKSFLSTMVSNVSNILSLINKKKFNSVILNYDETADNFLKWYQQLVAESTGKKGNGIFPIISTMPKDNHSLMQLYLDGKNSNFYTFFQTKENFSPKITKAKILPSQRFLKGKSLDNIVSSQILATKKVFLKKKIPFRSFYLKTRSEETLGELFTFFIIETILLAKALKINPYDQPAVELIKLETKKILT
ncbi:glucose-6-phosphate isomerase [Candidatus Pelagibacter sp.]|nr:glucose-6-phosphate isomerase [Candidatus Pelagibacter sp.]